MGYWEKVKEALGKVSKKIWIAIAAALVVLVAAVVIFLNTRPYATLITGATNEEFSTVISWLDSQGITDYKTEGSNTILVPEGQAVTLKARLLQEQYSTSNSAWAGYFERVSALSTIRDRDAAWLVTLMEDMESVIRQFPGVHDVDVKINTGEDNGYILDTNNVVNATATVFLFMENGKYLSDEQATAIRNYVSHSVAALKMEDVAIQDSNGNIYDVLPDTASSDPAATSALKMQMERYWSNFYRNQIEQMLYKAYGGEEHVGVTVHLNVELGDKTINDYQVHLPEFAANGETGGAGILANQFYSWQARLDDDTTVGGVVGTPSNSELPNYVENGETVEGMLGRLLAEGSREYDNSKTQTQMVITAGTITDISISVMLDSATSSTATGPLNVESMREFIATGIGIQIPFEMDEMTAEEYANWKAEYLSQKVGILVTPFYVAPEPQPEPGFLDTLESMGIPNWVVFAAIGGLVLFAVILILVIVLVRRGKKKKQAEEQRAIEEMLRVSMTGQPGAGEIGPDGEIVAPPVELDEDGNPVNGADVMDLHTERSMELRQNIRDYVDENMEVAALLLKSWLKEDVDNG